VPLSGDRFLHQWRHHSCSLLLLGGHLPSLTQEPDANLPLLLLLLPPGLPARRIWLELRKLSRAEQVSPGSWWRALQLSYHLGLLGHVLPWVQGSAAAAQQAVLVAKRLSQHCAEQQETLPLSLMVAATVPPSHHSLQAVQQQVMMGETAAQVQEICAADRALADLAPLLLLLCCWKWWNTC
jgi:hypothetical protein